MGRFIVPTLRKKDLRTKIVVTNQGRDTDSQEDTLVRKKGLDINVSVYSNGMNISRVQHYATLEFGKRLTILEEDLITDDGNECEYAIVVECNYKDHAFLMQESQVIYLSAQAKMATVVYDHFPPAKKAVEPAHPIILIAHKIWVSKFLNTFVLISNVNENFEGNSNLEKPFKFQCLSETGELLGEVEMNIFNETMIIDAKKLLPDTQVSSEEPVLFLLVGKGGGLGSCVINTLVFNEVSGSMAVEHSLFPAYYASGNRDKIREAALEGVGYA